MTDLARRAHLLNQLRDERQACERELLSVTSAWSLQKVQELKRRYLRLVRRIELLERRMT